MGESIEERFWRKVEKTEPGSCWMWIASTNGAGYGQIWHSMVNSVPGKRVDAHRCSWELHNGPIPAGMQVLHKCDNKLCVNPTHLYLGTRKDNMRDALDRGQKAIGTQCSFAKLSVDAVREIRELRKVGYKHRELATIFNVTRATILRACNGKAYRDVAFV